MAYAKFKIVYPAPGNKLVEKTGKVVTPPDGWVFQPSGDAGVTRKITARGEYWKVEIKRGKRMISQGVWAPAATVTYANQATAKQRSAPGYQQKLDASRKRRADEQQKYALKFFLNVRDFLQFHSNYDELEKQMAIAITRHAIPVGSGTVARTQTIPISERAAKAVIAWMRHQTTGYDDIYVPKIKGKRRELRRELAAESTQLLEHYRNGKPISPTCPLWKAVEQDVKTRKGENNG